MERFCMHCGTKLSEGEKFCPNCGASTEDVEVAQNNNIQNSNVQTNTVNNNVQSNTTAEQPAKTNGMAIASLVCSLVGLLIAGIWLGILAICFSIAAKKRMKVFTNEKGNGLATAGLVIGIIDVAFAFLGTIINVMTLF